MHVFAAQGYFKCRNGKLIPENQRCNRRYDCDEGDYSDEQKCRKFVNIIRRLVLSSLFHVFFVSSLLCTFDFIVALLIASFAVTFLSAPNTDLSSS